MTAQTGEPQVFPSRDAGKEFRKIGFPPFCGEIAPAGASSGHKTQKLVRIDRFPRRKPVDDHTDRFAVGLPEDRYTEYLPEFR
jgi:hypothetical protein